MRDGQHTNGKRPPARSPAVGNARLPPGAVQDPGANRIGRGNGPRPPGKGAVMRWRMGGLVVALGVIAAVPAARADGPAANCPAPGPHGAGPGGGPCPAPQVPVYPTIPP